MKERLFDLHPWSLPRDYEPRRPEHFAPERIVLAKGSLATEERRRFVAGITALYPEASVEERLDTPHNRIDPEVNQPQARHRAGKRLLVFGVHKSAVRLSEEENNTCPNYRHFSPYGFCPFDCAYCYLAGTRSVYFSPSVKIFVNLPEIMSEIDTQALRLGEPIAFYLGKLQDALALDPLTGYSKVLVPFFANHPFARMTLLTKSADVENLLDLEHDGHVILSWSLNPPEIHEQFERNVFSPRRRIEAMIRCAEAGYTVRAVLMPMIPVDGWREAYGRFLRELLETVPLQRLTMGGICSYPNAVRLMEAKLGPHNPISSHIDGATCRRADHRARFSPETRMGMYRAIIDLAKEIRPDLDLALCLEERKVMEAVGLAANAGRCNCVL